VQQQRQSLAAELRPLAHPSRMLLLFLLLRRDSTVAELSEQTAISSSLLRLHLKQLCQHGVVLQQWRGPLALYRADRQALGPLLTLLRTTVTVVAS
jgi:predicted ArsR family transcriptional regulator